MEVRKTAEVLLKMSWDSPYSNSFNMDYEYEDEQYDDDNDLYNDEPQNSDEDTEDASETDTGRKHSTIPI